MPLHVIARYADRLHTALGDGHHVASPLGAWLVLAVAAPLATGRVRVALEDALGEPAEDAAARADALLGDPHPTVAAAAALWTRADVRAPELNPVVERGAVPSQEGADQWAADRTRGLIQRFPVRVDASTLLVLASALATDVTWDVPFPTTPAESLWAGRITTALRSTNGALVSTPDAGDVAVHVARSADESPLQVVSVIAEPGVAAPTVLRAAHRIAADVVDGARFGLSLFDLPLGDGHAWTLTEGPSRPGRRENYVTTLPAWSAESTHDLLRDPRTGFGDAVTALARLLPPQTDGIAAEAVQSALARYSRSGFRAAAVTAIAARAGGLPRPGVQRTAHVRFGRPYAVVAVVGGGAWHGVPVFSAWVAEPTEA